MNSGKLKQAKKMEREHFIYILCMAGNRMMLYHTFVYFLPTLRFCCSKKKINNAHVTTIYSTVCYFHCCNYGRQWMIPVMQPLFIYYNLQQQHCSRDNITDEPLQTYSDDFENL